MFDERGAVDADGLFPALGSAIDGVRVPERGGSAVQLGEQLIAIVELERRLAAKRLAIVDAFHEQGFATVWGCDGTPSFMRVHTRTDARAARQQVTAAQTARRIPSLGALAAGGQIGVEHLQAVAAGLKDLPDEQVEAVAPTIAETAAWARPDQLRRLSRSVREMFRHEQAAQGVEQARALRELTLVRTFEDMWDLRATLPAEDGAALKVLLDATSAKAGEEDTRTPTQRRADGLAAIVALANRAGSAPALGGDRPRLTLVVRADETPRPPAGAPNLTAAETSADDASPDAAGLGALGWLPAGLGLSGPLGRPVLVGELTGHQLTLPDTVIQRIACDADLDVLTLDADGEVLRLGHAVRDANVAQRRGLIVRDGGCVFPHCDRPPWQCHPHHLRWWSKGGPTDINNLALLCPFHHHLVHDDGWTIDRIPAHERPPGFTGIGWQATSPEGHVLREFRKRIA